MKNNEQQLTSTEKRKIRKQIRQILSQGLPSILDKTYHKQTEESCEALAKKVSKCSNVQLGLY